MQRDKGRSGASPTGPYCVRPSRRFDRVSDPSNGQHRRATGAGILFVEVFTTDPAEHRRRRETRERGIPGFPEPTWDSIQSRRRAFGRRAFDGRGAPRLRLDSQELMEANARAIADAVGAAKRS